MLRVGLTGGIASGKTTVSDQFSQHGVPIIDTDIIAREVVAAGTEGLAQVVAIFGSQVLDGRGELNRRALRSIVFDDSSKLQALENILHPLIKTETVNRLAELTDDYVIIVVPLLVEIGMHNWVDQVLVVDIDPQTQRERLCMRDKINSEQAQAMMDSQLSRAERLAFADDVISNNTNDLEALRVAVANLDAHYRAIAHKRKNK